MMSIKIKVSIFVNVLNSVIFVKRGNECWEGTTQYCGSQVRRGKSTGLL